MKRTWLLQVAVGLVVVGVVMVGVWKMPRAAEAPPVETGRGQDAERYENVGKWLVSGAGSTDYNGSYVETGAYNGKPAYKLDDDHWLWWNTVATNKWVLAPALGSGDIQYRSDFVADLPGNPWQAVGGSAPAPSVEVDTSGGGDVGISMVLDITSPLGGSTITPGPEAVDFTATFGLVGGINPVNPVALALELFVQAVYENGETSIWPYTVLGEVEFVDGEAVFSGTVAIEESQGHTSLTLRLIGNATLTDSGTPTTEWTCTGSDEETPITIEGESSGSPPTVAITSPANGATVSATTPVQIVASDDQGLVSLALTLDGEALQSKVVAGKNATWAYQWDTTTVENGLHWLTVTATDNDGLTAPATVAVNVNNASPPSDTEDPVVEIVAPVAPATASGNMVVRANITDNVGVVRAECFFEGISQGELLAPNAGEQWRWIVDATAFANGSRTLTVEAWDAEGNHGYDTLEVTVDNSLASATWYIYTKQGSATNFPGRFRSGRNCSLGLGSLMVETPPENPASRLNVFLACDDGVQDPPVFEDMQPIEHMRAHGYLANAETVRFGIKGMPQQVLASWETGVLSAIRLREWTQGLLLLTPDAVLQFDGSTVTEYADLTGFGTGVDVAWWNGKIVVALGAGGALFLDPDAGQEPFVLEPLEGCTQIDVLEKHGTDLYVGARVDATNGMLWKLSAEWDLVNVEDTLPRVTALGSCGTSLGVGCAGGNIYSYATALNLALATGETNVTRIALVGSLVLAGTGSGGDVYRSLPSWANDGAFLDTTEVRGLAVMNGRIYAGGDRDVIWYRIGDEDWGQAGVVDADEINDMLVYNGGLYIATADAVEGKLWRLEVSPDSDLVSGTRWPCFTYEVLRRG